MANIEQVGLTVQNNAIHCGGCESRIETVLKKLPGVMKVSITLDTDKTLVLEVTKRLEAAGYRAS